MHERHFFRFTIQRMYANEFGAAAFRSFSTFQNAKKFNAIHKHRSALQSAALPIQTVNMCRSLHTSQHSN